MRPLLSLTRLPAGSTSANAAVATNASQIIARIVLIARVLCARARATLRSHHAPLAQRPNDERPLLSANVDDGARQCVSQKNNAAFLNHRLNFA